MTIQAKIDQHLNDPDLPRAVVVLNNESGSFQIPKGVRLTLRNCNGITCTSNGGMNELSLVNCTGITVKGFTNGVLRLEGCSGIQQIECTGSVQFLLANTIAQQLTFTNSKVELLGCTIQQLSMTGCRGTSIQSTYPQFTMSGGSFYSDKDTFSGTTSIKDSARITLKDATLSGDATLDTANVTMQNPTAQTVTITGGQLISNSGTMQTLTASNSAILIMKDTQVQTTSADGSVVSMNGTKGNDLTMSNRSTLTSQDAQLQTVTMSDSTGMLVGTTGVTQLTGTNSVMTLNNVQAQQCQLTGGAVDSTSGQYQQFTLDGGTLTSSQDSFQTVLTLTNAVGPNSIYKPGTIQTFSADGKDVTASLSIVNATIQTGTVAIFGLVELDGVTATTLIVGSSHRIIGLALNATTLTVQSSNHCQITNAQVTTGTFMTLGTLLLEGGSCSTATLTDCGTALISTCSISTLTASSTDALVTNSVGTGTITDCGCVLDKGSTLTVTNCNLIGNGGTYAGSGNTVIMMNAGTAINPVGLTTGMGFDASLQGGCVLYDGTDLTVECTTGDVDVKSLIKNINISAALEVNITDGL